MDRLALLLPLVLVGCGPAAPQPDYRSSNGVGYFWEGSSFEPSLIEEQENWFLPQLPDLGVSLEKSMHTLSYAQVHLYPDKIPCGPSSPSGFCNGLEDGTRLLVRNMGCPFNSALTHEMGHLIQPKYDPSHEDVAFWKVADGAPRSCP